MFKLGIKNLCGYEYLFCIEFMFMFFFLSLRRGFFFWVLCGNKRIIFERRVFIVIW